jgi:SlyX protein
MEDRLERLETRLMATEDLLDELNRTVWRQEQEIERLRAQLRQLADRVATAQGGNGSSRPEDEIPPHW